MPQNPATAEGPANTDSDRRFVWLHTTRAAKVWRVALAATLAVVLATSTGLGAWRAVIIATALLFISLLPVPIPDLGEPDQEIG